MTGKRRASRRRRRTPLERAARTLAVGAAVAVLVTGLVVAAVLLREASPRPAGDTGALVQPVAPPPDQPPVRFSVPAPEAGWQVSTPETVTGFATSDGGSVTVTRPAYYLRGWCADEPHWSSRGFVGVAEPVTGEDARTVNQALAQRWTDALAWDGEADGQLPASTPAQRRIELADGSRAWLSHSEVDLSTASIECAPPRAALTLVSFRVDQQVATVVAAVDLDVEHALTEDLVERILASAERSD
ncbi:hypothetical protein [Nocardioides sp.]|uniref:hypothetical protein n=1 Tax=Nocardioides sp. TaxID=35761 RepID=UPI0027360B98|nr:hypothetical protein [Nocardioides sp.]MDP3889898.1 hypothetical protein [Nocardioides sp.]